MHVPLKLYACMHCMLDACMHCMLGFIAILIQEFMWGTSIGKTCMHACSARILYSPVEIGLNPEKI